MVFIHKASIPLAAGYIHLDECSSIFRKKITRLVREGTALSAPIGGAHFVGIVNVESMAGALIIQHYNQSYWKLITSVSSQRGAGPT